MPVTPTYPGVYIEEIPSGVRTITGVATSIAAFLGRARRGPITEAVTINSFSDFTRIFGGLWQESRLGYAVRDFFINGGSRAIIVRLHRSTEAPTREQMEAAARRAAEDALSAARAAQEALENIGKVITDQDLTSLGATDPVRKTLEALKASARDAAAQTFDTARQKLLVHLGHEQTRAEEALQQATNEDERVAAKQTLSVLLTDISSVKTADKLDDLGEKLRPERPAPPPPPPGDQIYKGGTATLNVNDLWLEAASPGKWGNELRVRVTTPSDDEAARLRREYKLDDAVDLFNLLVLDGVTKEIETFTNLVAVAGHARDVALTLQRESRLVKVKEPNPGACVTAPAPHETTPNAGKTVWEDDVTSSGVTTRGSDGADELDISDFTGAGKGFSALDKVDLFNLLCIPPYKNLSDENGGSIDYDPLIAEAEDFCRKRRAFLLVDAPPEWVTDKAKAIEGMHQTQAQAATSNSAIFYPRLRQVDSERNNEIKTFAPCGVVAGIMARTDAERGVWKAPAGIDATLRGVSGLTLKLNDQENGDLNPLALNCMRTFPVYGHVLWGARTARGADAFADEWKYIPVRRLALFIEESLYRGLKWVVFEPNDEPLWSQIRLNAGAFMHDLFRQGAFQGKTPRETYFVKCDKETTTQNDIDRGIVNIHVGFAPLKPAEFVIIKLQQMAGQIQV